jgi:ABC-2 type transport system ATP-binding protein
MQNARLMASLYGVGWFRRRRRIRDLLTFLELWDARKRLAQDLSGGMRRRLGLATALIHKPSLLVVDEPTAGLDPALRARIWEYLEEIRRGGTTIILTTQYLEEAERCDHVAVLTEGRMIASGTPDDLRSRAAIPDALTVELDAHDRGDVAALWQLDGVREVRPLDPQRLVVRGTNTDELTPLITETLTDRGREVRAIEVERATFEDVFMQISSRR